jgi:chromosome partitioning protein
MWIGANGVRGANLRVFMAPASKDAPVRTIAIVNQKGGCGKTTTAINLAALYAARGLRTLVVDMDPQAHCAAGLGVPESRIEYSIGDALIANHANGFDPSPLVWEVARNLYLAPSTVRLAALEAPGGGLHQLHDKDRRLESLLNVLKTRFDRCLIDCPPTIGLLTFNAMRAAREALIPVETGFFSLRGAERQWTTIQKLIAHIGRPIACHLLPTLHNPQSNLACSILATLRRQFAGQILPIVIHEHEVLREAASFGQPVLEYAPQSKAREDFEALADWLEEHAAKPPVDIQVFPGQESESIVTAAPSIAAPAVCTMANPIAAPQAISIGPTSTPMVPGSRAAEMARRVHDLAARTSARVRETSDAIAPAPPSISAPNFISASEATLVGLSCEQLPDRPTHAQPPDNLASATVLREPPTDDDEHARATPRENLNHLYGVRSTSQGILFVQPAGNAKCMAIAGDFNYWSPAANPMTLNLELGVFEAIIPLATGAHQYRIVVDDQWMADPHNDLRQLNSYGEPNSVVVVSAPPLGAADAPDELGFQIA